MMRDQSIMRVYYGNIRALIKVALDAAVRVRPAGL